MCVSTDRREQTQSIPASYTRLSIPPFHSSSLKAQIFGTSSSLGGKSYRVEKSVIFGGNTAWDNSPLPFECQMQQLPWSHLPRGATVGPAGQRGDNEVPFMDV